ncbi:predicted protein [Chaetomium globosum CBS 148.51]|uniref:Uncharacterized protein n=1 Tax=Chaetomium globosum (strain ATCC 6205 / CBS 148.51 / DSM 1962 / NBRC 6347 / NRRL 1970) TaxID=306901 RepID=Q2H6C0_CHAGB|nr:uncharacterized protein CHGG_05795 [Chaetomium globosum CBS 148.51]EAQ89176.1 predicted protein [Chaetomium globosum CBS 148.51]
MTAGFRSSEPCAVVICGVVRFVLPTAIRVRDGGLVVGGWEGARSEPSTGGKVPWGGGEATTWNSLMIHGPASVYFLRQALARQRTEWGTPVGG